MRSGNGQPRKPRQQPAPEYGEGDSAWERIRDVAVAMQEGEEVEVHDVDLRESHPEAGKVFGIEITAGISLKMPKGSTGSLIVYDIPFVVNFEGDTPHPDKLLDVVLKDGQKGVRFTREVINEREDLKEIGLRAYQVFMERIGRAD